MTRAAPYKHTTLGLQNHLDAHQLVALALLTHRVEILLRRAQRSVKAGIVGHQVVLVSAIKLVGAQLAFVFGPQQVSVKVAHVAGLAALAGQGRGRKLPQLEVVGGE